MQSRSTAFSMEEVQLQVSPHGCSIDFLPGAKHLSGVEKSAFADILSKAAWSRT